MDHERYLELVAQFTSNLQKIQAMCAPAARAHPAVHVCSDVDLHPHQDVAVCLNCFARSTHLAAYIWDRIHSWGIFRPAVEQMDVAEDAGVCRFDNGVPKCRDLA